MTMKYIKSLLMVLFAGLAFTACNELECMEDDATVAYAESIPFGFYQSEYTADSDYEYGVVLTKGTAGDTIVNVIMTGREGTDEAGRIRTIAVCEGAKYDSKLGMLTASTEVSFYEDALEVALAYNRAGGLTLQVNRDGDIVATKLVKAETPSYIATWTCENSDAISINQEKVEDENGNESYEIVAFIGEDTEVDFADNGASATLSKDGKVVATMAYNANYEMVVTTADGKSKVYYRMTNEPEPEEFLPFAMGTYTHGVKPVFSSYFGQTFEPMMPKYVAAQYESVLYIGDKGGNHFIIHPWGPGEEGLYFEIGAPTAEGIYPIIIPGAATGFTGEGGARIFGVDGQSYFGGIEDFPCNFNLNSNILDFYICYVDSKYIYGIDYDNFLITGPAETAKKAAKMKSIQLKKQPKVSKTGLKGIQLNQDFIIAE